MFTKLRNRGFTLIELLVVIAIIGILSSVVLASLNSARQKSRDARRLSDIKQIQLGLELSFDDNGEYPDAIADLVTGGEMPSEPKDPVTDSSYVYDNLDSGGNACSIGPGSSCTTYHLGAVLEDINNTALPGANSTNGFNGSSKDCGATASTPVLCYDVIP